MYKFFIVVYLRSSLACGTINVQIFHCGLLMEWPERNSIVKV